MLSAYIRQYFPGVSRVGGYCCRPDTGAPGLVSIHGVGRAIDTSYPMVDGEANPLGTLLANWLVTNAASIGVQHVIWNRSVWTIAGGEPHIAAYTGPIPHTDHVHAELTRAGAAEQTPWFVNGGPSRAPVLPRSSGLASTSRKLSGADVVLIAFAVATTGALVYYVMKNRKRRRRKSAA